ncbi:hypothetical protein RRG08_027675 [Elysia crispata]|uniref:Uncharacterized protein n=1 Tax=Elysia crispata TaxID=231223 RepID=A0AAE0XM55_9GAST|nr:hypothetical protein RRG08_027675 [Elysia crispata]
MKEGIGKAYGRSLIAHHEKVISSVFFFVGKSITVWATSRISYANAEYRLPPQTNQIVPSHQARVAKPGSLVQDHITGHRTFCFFLSLLTHSFVSPGPQIMALWNTDTAIWSFVCNDYVVPRMRTLAKGRRLLNMVG